MLRVIIADDELEMRMVLKKALLRRKDVEIVGEAENGERAVELVEEMRPDAVFMDIEMPVLDGVSAANKMIDLDPKLKIIFITAFTDYMPQAFELYIFDYMVKPFKLERLWETVDKIVALTNEKPQVTEKYCFKTKDGTIYLEADEIFVVQRELRTTVIISPAGKLTVFENLSEVEEILPQNVFMRSHKSYIINKHKIKRIHPYGRWTFIVEFAGIKEDALMTSEKEKEFKNAV